MATRENNVLIVIDQVTQSRRASWLLDLQDHLNLNNDSLCGDYSKARSGDNIVSFVKEHGN
jgi:hypothetical protein